MKGRITEIKWSVIFVFMMLLWMVMERAAGLHGDHIDKHIIYTNFVAIPAILIYVLALRDKKKNDFQGHITYLQAFFSGVIITLVVTILTPLSQFIISTIISPNYFSNMQAHAVANKMMSEAQAQSYFSYSNYVIQASMGALIMGLLTSAIVAIFVKSKARKEPPNDSAST